MYRRLGARVTSAVLSVAVLAAFASPALAGAAPKYQPDGRIAAVCTDMPEWRNCDPSLFGDGIYNGTARNQKRVHVDYLTYSVERDPRVVVFRISIQNDGWATDRFEIAASGVTSGYTVKFLRGSTNVTEAVEGGSYTTPLLSPGATHVVKAKVVMPCDSWDNCGQDRADRLVTIRSLGSPSLVDAVKFVRKIWECTC
jgi:hypothetical protein